MNVLFVVSECVPFAKSGGLADVAGALPKELKKRGTDVRVMLPNYRSISSAFRKNFKLTHVINVRLGWRTQYCGILETEYEGITYYLIDNEFYFNRHTLYGYGDDGERFSFFTKAVLESLAYIDFQPDVIHCHDWHTGMINFMVSIDERYKHIKTVFTIHNLQFQGVLPEGVMYDLLELDSKYFNEEQLKFYDCINFMKAGIVSADKITTVSPTYKNEIQYAYFGENLDGLLRKYSNKLIGIVNGIDESVYHPSTDPSIIANYDMTCIEEKEKNKIALQRKFALKEDEDIPVIAMVTRLTKQKGLDLVRAVFHEIMTENIQFILLGTGDKEYEDFFREMEHMYKGKVISYIGFDENLAHEIYAGADLLLMPSLFEPCGLAQLIALQYGTLPIVRETGGLNDTVDSYNEYTDCGNGFGFQQFNAHDMLHAIRRAVYYYHEKECWNGIVQQAMSRDYSWGQSAKIYNDLYEELVGESLVVNEKKAEEIPKIVSRKGVLNVLK